MNETELLTRIEQNHICCISQGDIAVSLHFFTNLMAYFTSG